MFKWLSDFFLTLDFYFHRAKIREEVAGSITVYDAQQNQALVEADKQTAPPPAITGCVIKRGWEIVCYCRNCSAAKCDAIVRSNSGLTNFPATSAECDELAKQGYPACGKRS